MTYEEIYKNLVEKQAENLPELDNNSLNTYNSSILVALASALYILQLQQNSIQNSIIPSADSVYLEDWAAYEDLTRLAATSAIGYIMIEGTATTIIPISTIFNFGSVQMNTLEAVTIASNSLACSFAFNVLTQRVTVTTDTDHHLYNGQEIVIDALVTAYNGTYSITSINDTQFYYTLDSPSAISSATGTYAYDGVFVEVSTENQGQNQNVDPNSQIQIGTTIAGVDDAYVDWSGLTGGSDEETDAALYARTLASRSSVLGLFTPTEIEQKMQTINGVTRTQVLRVDSQNNSVRCYFLRDNDLNIFPNATQITEVKDTILTITPASIGTALLVVAAPTGTTVPITITDLLPNTVSMQTTITEQLTDFFKSVQIGESISINALIAKIEDSVDSSTGEAVQSFTLTSPTEDLSVDDNGVLIIGAVTYA